MIKIMNLEIQLNNGKIMTVVFPYEEDLKGVGYDFNGERKVTHKELIPYITKYGVSGEEFVHSLVEVLRAAYGEKGVRPYQEFKCKIEDDMFMAYMFLTKLKNQESNEKKKYDMMIGIKEALNDKEKQDLEELIKIAMNVKL